MRLRCSYGPISRGAYEVFDNVFLMNSCILFVWIICNKRWTDSFLQVSPISMDYTVRPPERDDEWNITVNHRQALFLFWRTNYCILCSFLVLERYYCASKHRLALGAGAKSLQQRRQCLSSTSDGCGEICVSANAFLWFLWFWMGNIKVAR